MPGSGLQLDEWLAQLETYSPQEIDLGLERVELMLHRLKPDLPETVFHIAGTNGKGSSVALLEALLRSADRRVGCYTSPHLNRYNERIRVDGCDASDAEIIAAFERVEEQRQGVPLTYFEFGTLAALLVFADRNVDIAILEVGMGGRLDAVNAVDPTASLITNVSLDHCDWLGDNVAAIAREKAGVMRSGKPVIFADPELPEAIADEALSRKANLVAATRHYHWTIDGDTWSWQGARNELQGLAMPNLAGDIQVQNTAGVLALLEAAGFTALFDAQRVNTALATVTVPGRAQLVADRFILDVAHNPAAASALAKTIGGFGQGRADVAIIGMLDDKDVAGVVASLAALTGRWIAITADSPRAIPAADLAQRVRAATGEICEAAESMAAAIDRANVLAGEQGQILITGSFYTVGAALVILAAPRHEYG
ncbi:MAG: bifunctional folylpolyglutamate synthase/dihydrofolate synthase [Woeseiaceae bacterium]